MGSEYGGTGPRAQPVQPMGVGALTAGEEILLLNFTGTTNPYAPLDDGRTWEGLDRIPRHVAAPRNPYPVGDRDDTGGK